MQAFLRAAEGIRTLDLLHGKQTMGLSWARKMPANERLRQARRRAGVPRIVRRYRRFRQGTDNERSQAWWARGSRCRVRLGFEGPGARFLLLQQEKASAELTRLPIEGAADLLLVHRSSSDERADSAPADTCVSSIAEARAARTETWPKNTLIRNAADHRFEQWTMSAASRPPG